MKTALRRGMAALLSLFLLAPCPGCAAGTSAAAAADAGVSPGAARSPEGDAQSAEPARERPQCLESSFHAEAAEELEWGSIDCSALSEGYVAVSAVDENRLKFCIAKGEETYTYDLPGDGTPAVFPLNMGSGTYVFQLMRGLGGTKYARVWEESREVALADEFSPFLLPSRMVNYSADSACVEQAWQLTQSCGSDAEIAASVYRYLVEEIHYDDAKARSVKAGYLPDPDATLADKQGICFDYAALAAAMLRSQGIPCQLITGYVGEDELYHAWNRFYLKEQGWITAEIEAKGGEWKRVDITFASEGVDTEKLEDDSRYTTRYTY